MLEISAYRTGAVVHFTDQNWIHKTVHCIRCVMASKIGFTNWNAKIALLRASMVVTYYIKLFRTGADRHKGILMSLLLLVAETETDLPLVNLSLRWWFFKISILKNFASSTRKHICAGPCSSSFTEHLRWLLVVFPGSKYFFQLNLLFIADSRIGFCSEILWKHKLNLRSNH